MTIDIGGGTPTTLEPELFKKLLETISRCTDTSKLAEYTLEGGRPDTITEEKLRVALEYGVGRMSINPQTMNDIILRAIGRRHTVDDSSAARIRSRARSA